METGVNIAATYGRVRAGIGAVISTLIAIVLIGLSIWIFIGLKYTPPADIKDIKITEVKSCVFIKETHEYKCDVVYSYINQYKQHCKGERTITSASKPVVGDAAVSFYPESDDICTGEKIPVEKKTVPKWLGGVLLVIGLLMIVIPWVWFYFEMRSKSFAAGMGVVTGVSDIASGIAAPFTRH